MVYEGNRRFHNRPTKHTTSHISNVEVGHSIETMYDFTEDGLIGRRFEMYRDGYSDGGIHLDPVKWRKLLDGRLYITFNGDRWYAHQIAWYLKHKVKPHKIKFKDGDKSNYRLNNLEIKTTTRRPYQAQVRVNGKTISLGSYSTREEQQEAQNAFKALRKMGLA